MPGVDNVVTGVDGGEGAVCENGCHATRREEFLQAVEDLVKSW